MNILYLLGDERMKKIFIPCVAALALSVTLPNLSFATANWWGDRCDEKTNICVNILNVKQNNMGFWSFLYTFYNKGEDAEKGLCSGVAAFESEESREAGSMFYNFSIGADNATLTVSHEKDVPIKEEDGCTKAFFGTYK